VIKDALLAAGFVDVICSVIRHDQPLSEAARLARGLIYGAPVAEQVRQRGAEPENVVPALTEASHADFGPDPTRMPLQALFIEARKPR
jgi:hypothetical protein